MSNGLAAQTTLVYSYISSSVSDMQLNSIDNITSSTLIYL